VGQKIYTSAQINLIGHLRAKRYSFAAIGRYFGVSYQRVQQICKRHGFTMLEDIQEHDLLERGVSNTLSASSGSLAP
jgi:predicted DNA-binding protein YlxM (UPF0122 family)